MKSCLDYINSCAPFSFLSFMESTITDFMNVNKYKNEIFFEKFLDL